MVIRWYYCLATSLLAGAALLLCCSGHITQTAWKGGSEVVGKLVTSSSAPVNNARVIARSTDSSHKMLLPGRVAIDTVFTSGNGQFRFTNLDLGTYNLIADFDS